MGFCWIVVCVIGVDCVGVGVVGVGFWLVGFLVVCEWGVFVDFDVGDDSGVGVVFVLE